MSATIRIILRDGYDKLTITAIAGEANYTRRAFYLHFKNIDDIIDEILIDFFLSTHDEIMNATAHLTSPQREYSAWLKWAEIFHKNREFCKQIPLMNDIESGIMTTASATLKQMLQTHDLNLRDDVSLDMLIYNEQRFFALLHNLIKKDASLEVLHNAVDDHFRLMFHHDPPDIDI